MKWRDFIYLPVLHNRSWRFTPITGHDPEAFNPYNIIWYLITNH